MAPFGHQNHDLASENHSSSNNSHIENQSLTQRQREILILLAQGLTYDQIGHRIGFSHSTVRMELMHIYRAFGVTSREEAVQWARNENLIPSKETDDQAKSKREEKKRGGGNN